MDGLVKEILAQINSENEVYKLQNSHMKIHRTPDESIATVLGRIKTLYISIYRIRYPMMDQATIDKISEVHTLTPETNTLFQQYYRVVLGEGDNMTTGLASSFIGTSEATSSKNRNYATHQLPTSLANLDLFSFDSSDFLTLWLSMLLR